MNLSSRNSVVFGRSIRKHILGLDEKVAVHGGGRRSYVNFDNAATTPALKIVAEKVAELLRWYGSVHRGTGTKSQVSSACYERCREIVAEFVGANLDRHAVIFTRSTTDSINKLARTFGAQGQPHILCTLMEHHSNILPWRAHCRVEYVNVCEADGSLDLNHLEDRLRAGAGSIRLVAVTGASNVTGLMPPIYTIARLAHDHGAEIVVDAAQVMAHRPIRMGEADDPERLDYLVFSGHKMYAPFGAGVLVGLRETFEKGAPECVGGGSVRMVTQDTVVWADVPERQEAGTPNLVGTVALASAIRVLKELGLEGVAAYEGELRALMAQALSQIPGIVLFGDPPAKCHDQAAVISFLTERLDHNLFAAALGHEWGVGVRNGCFCAHPYIIQILRVSDSEVGRLIQKARCNDHSGFPGLVRISLAMYNTREEVEYVAGAIRDICENGPHAQYKLDVPSGQYVPQADVTFPLEGFHL